MKTILITGGLGFIGTNVAKKFLREGWNVIAFDNMERPGVAINDLTGKYEHYTFVKGDVRTVSDLEQLGAVDGVIHLAANPGIPRSIKDPRFDFETNAMGTLNVLEFARSRDIPVVYASTNKVYSDAVCELPLVESKTRYDFAGDYAQGVPVSFPVDGMGKNPHSPYGCSKYTGDIYCQEYFHTFGVKTTVFRMSCIYGEHQLGVEDQGWVSWFMIAKHLGNPLTIYGNGKQVRDCLFGEDVAELYFLAIDQNDKFAGKVFNVGGGPKNTVSLLESIALIDDMEGGTPLAVSYTDWRIADHRVYVTDIGELADLWQPKTSIQEGFARTMAWIKENL